MQYDLCKVIVCVYILVGLFIVLDYIDMVIDFICGFVMLEDVCNGLMEGVFIEDRDKFWKQFGLLIEQVDIDEYLREEGNVFLEVQVCVILDMWL